MRGERRKAAKADELVRMFLDRFDDVIVVSAEKLFLLPGESENHRPLNPLLLHGLEKLLPARDPRGR
jgi:hypothetical protein